MKYLQNFKVFEKVDDATDETINEILSHDGWVDVTKDNRFDFELKTS